MIYSGSNALTLNTGNDGGKRALKCAINHINFAEYFNLKYYYQMSLIMKKTFIELIFQINIEKLSQIEKYMQLNNFMQLKRDVKKEWKIFIKYGGLQYTLNKSYVGAKEYTLEIKDDIIRKDLSLIKPHTKKQ